MTRDKCTSERAQNVGDTVTSNETEHNIQEKITETSDGDETVVMSDDECTGNKELPDLLMQDVQSFGEEVDCNSKLVRITTKPSLLPPLVMKFVHMKLRIRLRGMSHMFVTKNFGHRNYIDDSIGS